MNYLYQGSYPVPDLEDTIEPEELYEGPEAGKTCLDCQNFRYLNGRSGLGLCKAKLGEPTKSPIQPACEDIYPYGWDEADSF